MLICATYSLRLKINAFFDAPDPKGRSLSSTLLFFLRDSALRVSFSFGRPAFPLGRGSSRRLPPPVQPSSNRNTQSTFARDDQSSTETAVLVSKPYAQRDASSPGGTSGRLYDRVSTAARRLLQLGARSGESWRSGTALPFRRFVVGAPDSSGASEPIVLHFIFSGDVVHLPSFSKTLLTLLTRFPLRVRRHGGLSPPEGRQPRGFRRREYEPARLGPRSATRASPAV